MKQYFLALITAGCIGLSTQGYADYLCNDPCAPICYETNYFGGGNQFQGFYVGANLGWAFHDHLWTDRDAWVDNFEIDWALGTTLTTNDGVTVGVQIGYNWQCNCSLFGFEADANWADLKRTKHYAPSEDPEDTKLTLSHELNWYGTLRGRAGIIADNLLLYTTAGVAWAHSKNRWVTEDVDFDTESFREERARWGLALGTGIEWMYCSNFSFKAEGLYLKFPEHTKSGFSPNGLETVHFDQSDSVWIFRIGVNYNLSCFGCFAY